MPQSDTSLDRYLSQPRPEIPRMCTPIQMISSVSDSDQESHYSGNSHSVQDYRAQPKRTIQFFCPAPRQSGRSRKPTEKIESQQKHEAEEQSRPKRRKIRKSKIDVTSQLKELLASDIEFSIRGETRWRNTSKIALILYERGFNHRLVSTVLLTLSQHNHSSRYSCLLRRSFLSALGQLSVEKCFL